LLFAFPGAILPAWGYHLRPHFAMVGNYFLALNLGVLAAALFARAIRARAEIGGTLIVASVTACVALALLALAGPPVAEWWRVPPLVLLGLAAGLLTAAIFHAISPAYRLNRAATVNVGGMFFGLGSVVAPLLVAGTFEFYRIWLIFLVVGLVPGVFAVFAGRVRFPRHPLTPERSMAEFARESTMPTAILLSALLFFHFGNEFAIAGWLPLFLIGRIGMSPVSAMILVAAYWAALTVGRLATQVLLPHVSHFLLLLASAVAALFGCLVLTFTNNLFGAWFGTLLIGLGFAPVYPLVVEKIGARFPHYHPGIFNGIFSVGLTGGMLAPATIGYGGEFFGMGFAMALPAIGTAVVVLLVLIIWAEARLAEWMSAKPQDQRLG
jgi:fucose permease